jgi:EAL and modified HD-GYP domain-containing signal transduction protein
VVDTLGLADDIRSALLERSGPIGQLLRLAQALESDDDSIVRDYIAANASRAALTINHSQGQALLWANKVLQAA